MSSRRFLCSMNCSSLIRPSSRSRANSRISAATPVTTVRGSLCAGAPSPVTGAPSALIACRPAAAALPGSQPRAPNVSPTAHAAVLASAMSPKVPPKPVAIASSAPMLAAGNANAIGRGWRRKLVVNLSAGIMSTVVVGIFVVAKFTEGAWLIVVVFPVLVLILMRLNQKYRAEASVLEMAQTEHLDLARHPRLRVLVFVDSIDLAEIEALRHGDGMHADELTAVHFVIDVDHAMALRERWDRFEHDTPLQVINCPDRHLSKAAHDFVWRELSNHPNTMVTVLLPRRTYSPLLGRLLHDRTADKMARAVSRIRGATAIIVPYDIESRIARIAPVGHEPRNGKVVGNTEAPITSLVGD